MAKTTGRLHRRTLARLRSELAELMRTVRHLRAAAALLSWDQETQMPAKAADSRARHLATLEGLIYRELTSSRARRLAERLTAVLPHLPDRDQRMARLFLREFHRAAAVPQSFAERLAYTQAMAVDSWRYARQENDFYLFAPYLQQLVQLKREQAEYYGYTEHPYDALLELYEPGMRLSTVRPLLEHVVQRMRELLQWVQQHERPRILLPPVSCTAQFILGRHLCTTIGFDLERGRVDYSAHPFSTAIAANDVRITTRCSEQDPRMCVYSLLHELGHALYDQNIPAELADTFAGEGASMGIHESQSLLWEDIIGRSLAFCRWSLPLWRYYSVGAGSSAWERVTAEQLFRALNSVEPSLIRTEADEVTYHMHILLRLELEEALLMGKLRVKELPEAWNAGMERLLGIRPPDDRTGCLQDIHWSLGDFGYFPSYSLGKLYAAMFWKRLRQDIPDVDESIAQGDFEPILTWLRRHIYGVGALETPEEILHRVTGERLSADAFVDYITDKLRLVYSDAL